MNWARLKKDIRCDLESIGKRYWKRVHLDNIDGPYIHRDICKVFFFIWEMFEAKF